MGWRGSWRDEEIQGVLYCRGSWSMEKAREDLKGLGRGGEGQRGVERAREG